MAGGESGSGGEADVQKKRDGVMGDMTPIKGGFGDTAETIRGVMGVIVDRAAERGTPTEQPDEDGVFRPLINTEATKAK